MRNTFQVLLGLVAVFGLGLGIAFGGGVLYGRTSAKAAPAPAVVTTQAGGGAGAGAGAGGQGTQAGQAGAGQARAAGNATGVIEKIEGATLTLRTQQGTSTVTFSAETEVRQTVGAQAADLKVGQTVVATGAAGGDGNLQARTLTIAPAAAATGGQGTPAAGQGGQRGTATATPGR